MALPHPLLLVEDHPLDVRLINRGHRGNPMIAEILVAAAGGEALEMLKRTGRHADAPRPDLVLLDLNLPVPDGRELLARITSDADVAPVPVVILDHVDRGRGHPAVRQGPRGRHGGKPLAGDDPGRIFSAIERFWLRTASLPAPILRRGESGAEDI